jgi:hypothetical protein
MIEERIDRILTQYRESPNLLVLIRNGLQEAADAGGHLDAIQEAFAIDTSLGDQVTIIGKWLGGPRTHCEGIRPTVFGFECIPEMGEETAACSTAIPVAGFCEGARWACPGYDFEDYTRHLGPGFHPRKADLGRRTALPRRGCDRLGGGRRNHPLPDAAVHLRQTRGPTSRGPGASRAARRQDRMGAVRRRDLRLRNRRWRALHLVLLLAGPRSV